MRSDAVSETADRVLREYRVWAVVGASPRPGRASYGVMGVLEAHGYTVIPVNPHTDEVRGRVCYPDLASVPDEIEVVDIFRRSTSAGAHVDEAIEVGAKAVWLQLGVVDEAAAARAEAAGLTVVMNRCPAIELSKGLGRA
ncbi:MAG TPA: CoA-binding protein [Egibacteraceae bacterium]|nr:CoA-binding protein [Egibacteraceae bacterium]